VKQGILNLGMNDRAFTATSVAITPKELVIAEQTVFIRCHTDRRSFAGHRCAVPRRVRARSH
jgi:hypothetical protein